MPGLTNRARLQLALPLLAIGATIAIFATAGIVGEPRAPEPPPAPVKGQAREAYKPIPPIRGMRRPPAATVQIWLDSFYNLLGPYQLTSDQRITGAGVTANNRWGYLATTPARQGGLAGRYVLFRSDAYGWQVVGVTHGANRIRDCARTDSNYTQPASFAAQLQRDRFRCGPVE